MIVTAVVFLLVLSILVIVHEFGHFAAARMLKIGVEEFALGMPFTPPIFSKKTKDGIKISLYPLLFGGFVKLLGEDGESGVKKEKAKRNGGYFYQAPVWQRMTIVLAGVFMNIVLAATVFYVYLAMANFQVLIPRLSDYKFVSPKRDNPVVIVSFVAKDSPADTAGIKPGDIIASVDGQGISSIKSFQSYAKSHGGRAIKLAIIDQDLKPIKTVTIIPRANPPENQGPVGVGIGEGVVLSYRTPGERFLSGVYYGTDMLVYNFSVLGSLLTTAKQTNDYSIVAEGVSGPIGIGSLIGDILKLGGREAASGLINFVGLLSLSLAFMNVLPLPALDGGRFAFLVLEGVTKRKFTKLESIVNQFGMIFLLILIAIVSLGDLWKIFWPLFKR